MAKHWKVDVVRGEIEGSAWLQLFVIRSGRCLAVASVFWLNMEGKAPELCNLYVEESARRQGIAQALIAAARQQLQRPFCLHVARESDAYWLYRKLGFEEVGAVKEKEDNVWMLSR